MRRPARLLCAVVLATLVVGCHARFKKAAPTLGAVKTQAFSSAIPEVQLGRVNDDSLVGAVVNTVQIGLQVEVQRKIRDAVQISDVNDSLLVGIAEALGDGPPFAYTDADKAGGVLQLEIVRWGLFVPQLGAQGDFRYDLRTRIYGSDSRVVYKARARCSTAAGNPSGFDVAIGTVNNVRQIKEMPDEAIQRSFEEVARWCGYEVVRKMRKHAG